MELPVNLSICGRLTEFTVGKSAQLTTKVDITWLNQNLIGSTMYNKKKIFSFYGYIHFPLYE